MRYRRGHETTLSKAKVNFFKRKCKELNLGGCAYVNIVLT